MEDPFIGVIIFEFIVIVKTKEQYAWAQPCICNRINSQKACLSVPGHIPG